MENLFYFTLFGNNIAFFIVTVVLWVTLVISDENEDGLTAFIAVVIFLGLNYFWGTLPLSSIFSLRNVLIYLFLGFIFSIIRTYAKGVKFRDNPNYKKNYDLKDHVFRWWLLAPVCLVNWMFKDLLKDLFNWVYKRLEKFYIKIFNL